MLRTPSRLAAAALTLSALVPAAAVAAGVHSHPQLRSSPQMRIVDDDHAMLRFASDRIARTAAGAVDAKVTYVNGARVSGLKLTGMHGRDIVYSASVSSVHAMKDRAKFTVRFRLGKSSPVVRSVKLFAQGEHG